MVHQIAYVTLEMDKQHIGHVFKISVAAASCGVITLVLQKMTKGSFLQNQLSRASTSFVQV